MDHVGRIRPKLIPLVLPPEIHVRTRKSLLGRLALLVLPLLLSATTLFAQADQAPADAPPAPAPAPGQQAPGATEVPDSIQQMIQEFRGLQNRLASLQDSAIQQSETLQTQRDEVQEAIQTAMTETNPELEEDMARMEELQQEMSAAQEAQDQERMMQLSMEAGQIRSQLQSAQADVMERPAIQQEISTFQENLLDEMIGIEPETEELIAELEDLNERFRQFQQDQQGVAPGPPPGAGPGGPQGG